jgi:AcrR family transcriptional regulator
MTALTTRERIYRAAVDYFYYSGFAGATLREIADLAGVNVATIYYYFSSKTHLLVAVMEATLRDLNDGAERGLEGARDPDDALARLVAHHVHFHCVRPHEAVITDREVNSVPINVRVREVSLRDAYERQWDQVLAEGASCGVFQFPDRRVARIALLTMCSQVAVWYEPEGRFSPQEVAGLYTEFARRLAGSTGPRTARTQ